MLYAIKDKYLERFCEICKIFVIVAIAKFLNVDEICLWLQCLLFVIVGLNWWTILTILLIWLSRTVISSPT